MVEVQIDLYKVTWARIERLWEVSLGIQAED